tara:strand:- start:100 stop:216 length:117 start_codon:yes stop_codon:yes gene_type:complete
MLAVVVVLVAVVQVLRNHLLQEQEVMVVVELGVMELVP